MLFAQTSQGVSKLVSLFYHQASKQRGSRRSAGDLIHHKADAGGIDEVENVIERGSQTVDVFAIERSDEGLVKLGENIVRHVVAAMLNVLELLDARINVLKVFQHLFEQTGAITQIAGHFGEHVEKLCVSWNKADHVSGRSPGTLLRDR